MAIILKADVKDYLNIGDTSHDDFIDSCTLIATAQINKIIGYAIEEQTRTIQFNGDVGNQVLSVNEYLFLETIVTDPITSLSDRDEPLDSFATISAAKYTIIEDGSITKLWYDTGFSKGTSNYKIIYTSGWSAANMPKDIKNVAIEMCAVLFKESDVDKSGRLGLSSIIQSFQGQAATQTTKDLLPRWNNALKNYRIMAV